MKKQETKRKPTNGFKKGQSGNPSGRRKLPDDVREIRQMESTDFIRIAHRFLNMTLEKFQKEAGNKKMTIREARVYRMIGEELKGNIRYSVEMNDRLMGKAFQEVQLSGDDKRPLRFILSNSKTIDI